MRKTGVQMLSRVLRVLVIITFVCNILALLIVPDMVSWMQSEAGVYYAMPWNYDYTDGLNLLVHFLSFVIVWQDGYSAVLTVFLWVCGICTAVILWQAKRVLDSILKADTFTLRNAANMRRAAVCCFVISAAALARLIWSFCSTASIRPLYTYNALFVPIFTLGGLVLLVMSALFRQAAELKAENDLTI